MAVRSKEKYKFPVFQGANMGLRPHKVRLVYRGHKKLPFLVVKTTRLPGWKLTENKFDGHFSYENKALLSTNGGTYNEFINKAEVYLEKWWWKDGAHRMKGKE